MINLESLKQICLFKGLSDEDLKKVASVLKEKFYPKGTIIWEEDSVEQGLQIIEYGQVRITKRTKERQRQMLGMLREGKFFGELSLLDGRNHSAELEAIDDTKVLVLSRADMARFLVEDPQIAYTIVREIAIDISKILREMNERFMGMVNYIWQ
jgi:CRP-like cAMP-binding protein